MESFVRAINIHWETMGVVSTKGKIKNIVILEQIQHPSI